jgi:mRNA interferase MazF
VLHARTQSNQPDALDQKAIGRKRVSKKFTDDKIAGARMEVKQGDIFWISPNEENKIASDHTHPHVVIQHDTLNTIVICALTTNLKRAKALGNILLEEGEANLPKQSVVSISQVSTVDKSQLGEYIGTLSEERIRQVLAGIQFLEKMVRRNG